MRGRTSRGRTRAGLVGLATAAAVAAVVVLVPSAPRTSLGQLDRADVASEVVPPGPLRAELWRAADLVPTAAADARPLATAATSTAVAVRDGAVVAVPGGAVTRPGTPALPTRGGIEATLVGDRLLLLDGASGAVLRGRRLVDEGERRPSRLVGWVDNDLLAVDRSGRLVRLGNDGAVRWRAMDGVLPPPTGTVARGWVLVTSTATGRDHVVLDLRTGEPGAWAARVGALGQPRAVRLPDGPTLVLAVRDGVVTAWTLPSGRVRWTATLGDGGDVVLADGSEVLAALVLAEDGTSEVVRLDADDGTTMTRVTGPRVAPGSRGVGRWAVDGRGAAVVTPAGVRLTPWRRDARLLPAVDTREVGLVGDVVAVGAPGPDGATVVQLRDRDDGTVIADVPVGPPVPPAPVAVVGGHVAVAGADGVGAPVTGLRWLRLTDGAEVPADVALRGALGSTPPDRVHLLGSVEGGVPLLVRTGSDGVHVLDRDGTPSARPLAGGWRPGAPVPRAVGTAAGQLVLAVGTHGRGGGAVVDLARVLDGPHGTGSARTGRTFGDHTPVAVAGPHVLTLDPRGRLVTFEVGTAATDPHRGDRLAAAARSVAATAVVVGDVVVAATDERTLVGIDPSTATVVWTRPLRGRLVAPPVAWADGVATITDDGSLVVHDTLDGEPVRVHEVDGDAPTALATAGGRLVLGTVTGRLQVLDRPGRVIDEHALGAGPVTSVVVVDGRVVAAAGTSVVSVGAGSGS